MVLIELNLNNPDGFLKVLIRELRVDNGVASVLQVGRFDAARNRLPAVEEEDGDHLRKSLGGLSCAWGTSSAGTTVLTLDRIRWQIPHALCAKLQTQLVSRRGIENLEAGENLAIQPEVRSEISEPQVW